MSYSPRNLRPASGVSAWGEPVRFRLRHILVVALPIASAVALLRSGNGGVALAGHRPVNLASPRFGEHVSALRADLRPACALLCL